MFGLFHGESENKMDDLGVAPVWETSKPVDPKTVENG